MSEMGNGACAAQQSGNEKNKKAPAVYDPWKDMRTVFVPKISRTEQDTLEVGVNDKTYFIPKDRFIQVPAPVWEVLQGMLDQRRAAEDFAKKNSGEKEHGMAF